jgi:DNA polymerase-3 subunit alpha
MGKKKPEEMAQHRKIFSDGAKAGGITEGKANEIYDLMERFAGYGFNKSHAAAYALLAYQTAWLKAYYPAEFMAANLSLAMDDTDKVKILYDDCLANHIRVFSPDINTGVYVFTPLRAPDASPDSPISHIRYGLGAVRGTGEAAIEVILKARETGGPFKDLFDFCARVDRRQVNRRAIEALMRAGAFDSLYKDSIPAGGNPYDIRSTLLASLARAIEAAEQAEASINQVSLFEVAGEDDRHLPELVRELPWSEKKRLQDEKSALGLCLTGHMFDAYRDETAHFIRQPLVKVTEGKDQLIAGIITSARMLTGQRGRMMIATIDDGTAAIEVTLYSEVYEPNRSWLKEDELLVAKVNITPDKFSGGVRIVSEAVMDITGARMRFARNLHLSIDSAIDLKSLRSQIGPYLMSNRIRDPKLGPAVASMPSASEGMKGLMLTAAVTTSGGACLMQFPEELRIYPDDACLHSLNQILAAKQSNTVQVQYL